MKMEHCHKSLDFFIGLLGFWIMSVFLCFEATGVFFSPEVLDDEQSSDNIPYTLYS
jgi:hypothetical protein